MIIIMDILEVKKKIFSFQTIRLFVYRNLRCALFFVGILSVLYITSSTVFAQSGGTNPNFNPIPADNLYDFIRLILENIVIPIGGVIAVMAIIFAGFLFVTAQGNPNKISQARSAFVWAVIGGLILLGSWAIASAIEATMSQVTGG